MSMVMADPQQDKVSLQHESVREADRHKWIESEKHGHDLGEQAVLEWYQNHWLSFCRRHRIEHVVGHSKCQEFPDGPSKFILNLLKKEDLLVELILDRLLCGWENLDIIVWGLDWGLPTDRIIEILEQLNINCARLDPPMAI